MSDFIKQKPLILASGSKSRQQLLNALGLIFEIKPSEVDEDLIKSQFQGSSFQELAQLLAQAKALAVSNQYPDHYIIAADQLCVMNKTIFDKPMNHANAVEQLKKLSGKSHQQIAACCIAKAGKILWEIQDVALLEMHVLEESTIQAYLHKDKPYYSCGAFHYEGAAKWLFRKVHGSDSTIQGLPIHQLIQALISLEIVMI